MGQDDFLKDYFDKTIFLKTIMTRRLWYQTIIRGRLLIEDNLSQDYLQKERRGDVESNSLVPKSSCQKVGRGENRKRQLGANNFRHFRHLRHLQLLYTLGTYFKYEQFTDNRDY